MLLQRLHVRLEKRPLRVLGVGGCRPLEPSRREPLLHRRARPLQRAVHGGDAHLEYRGGLVCGPVERVAEDQDRALARRKMLDRGEKRELDRLSRDDRVIRLGALVEQAIGVRLQPGEIGGGQWRGAELGGGAHLVGHEAPRPALENPEAGVGRDPVEPGAERRLPVVGRATSTLGGTPPGERPGRPRASRASGRREPGARSDAVRRAPRTRRRRRSSPRRSAVGRARLTSLKLRSLLAPKLIGDR